MDEKGYDTIYEVVLIEDTDWWVDEEEYNRVKKQISGQIPIGLIEFTTVDGFEVTTTKDKIIYLAMSTRKVRDVHRERNKKYKETELDVNKKQEWEE